MLEQMRKGAKHPIVKAMFFLLAGMFVVWGVGDVFRNNSGTAYVATIGKSGVTMSELDNMVKGEIDRYQKITGKTLTAEEIDKIGVKKYALGQLIREKITNMRASDLNLSGGKRDIEKQIEENKVFFDEQGKFSKEHFKEVLRANGLTEEKFANSVKKEAAVNNLLGTLTAAGISTDVMAKAIFTYRNERRVADIITVPADLIKEVADPADTDLVQFYKDNQDNFAVPEQRAVSFVSFNADKIKSTIKLSDDELKTQYHNNIQQYKTEETRDVSQYLFDKEVDANAAYEKISKGDVKGFEANKIQMGKVTKLSVPEEVKGAVFSLKLKEVGKPAKSSLGWHIFIVNYIEAEKILSFDEVKKDIEKELLEKKSSDEFAKFGNQIEDEFAAGKKMEDIAKTFGLKMSKVPFVNDKGEGENAAKVADLPDHAVSLPLVFGMDSGVPSALTLLSDNSTYAIFRVDSITPKRVKALDEVKGLAIKAWKESQKGKLLKAKADEIASKLRAGEDYKELASKMNLKLDLAKNFTRLADATSTKNESGEMKNELFNLKKIGGFTGAHQAEGGSFVIARLVKINIVKPEDDKNGYKNIQTQLEDEMRDDIMAQYTNFLRDKFPISVRAHALGSEEK